jgi:plastocyanin
MKAIAGTAGLTALVLSLAVPALLLAQEPAPEGGEATTTATAAQSASAAEEDAGASDDARAVTKASGTVEMIDYRFSPKTITIDEGDSVTWRNTGDEDHDADAQSFSTGTVKPNRSKSETFSDPGTFKYVCTFHADMKGEVVVKAASGGVGDDTDEEDDDTTSTTTPTDTTTTDPTGSTFDSSSGSSSSLPSTGQNEIPLIVVGAAFLICGLLVGALWRAQSGP